MTRIRLSRRQLLGGAATTVIAGLALGRGASVHFIEGSPLALLDGTLSNKDLALARRMLAPLEPRILGSDLVWEWRDELSQELARGVGAVAITRWDKALLFSELARETALPVHQRRIGRSIFRTAIG